jgi:hypothetical protein
MRQKAASSRALREANHIAHEYAVRWLTTEEHHNRMLSAHYARSSHLMEGVGNDFGAKQARREGECHRVRACMAWYDLARWLKWRP